MELSAESLAAAVAAVTASGEAPTTDALTVTSPEPATVVSSIFFFFLLPSSAWT